MPISPQTQPATADLIYLNRQQPRETVRAAQPATSRGATAGGSISPSNLTGEDLNASIDAVAAAASLILDADIAVVKARLVAVDIMTRSVVAAISQATHLPMELLRGGR